MQVKLNSKACLSACFTPQLCQTTLATTPLCAEHVNFSHNFGFLNTFINLNLAIACSGHYGVGTEFSSTAVIIV